MRSTFYYTSIYILMSKERTSLLGQNGWSQMCPLFRVQLYYQILLHPIAKLYVVHNILIMYVQLYALKTASVDLQQSLEHLVCTVLCICTLFSITMYKPFYNGFTIQLKSFCFSSSAVLMTVGRGESGDG